MDVDFKKILGALAFVVGTALLFSGCEKAPTAIKSDKVTWKLATSWGTDFPPFANAVENMANMVHTMSAGAFTISIDTVNKHKSAFGVMDMVKQEQYEMGHTASYYYKGKDPVLPLFTSMPFGMNALEQYGWFYFGGGMGMMQKSYEKHGMYAFPGGNTGVQMGGWFRKEITSLKDLKGLKIRIPGYGGEIFAKLGCAVTNIAAGELFASLERGTIDALEWVGPGMDIGMGFHKIAPYYYTGWQEPATELQFIVGRAKFDALSPKNKEILRVAMRTAAYDMLVQNYDMSTTAWEKIKTEYPTIKVKTFPKPVMDAMRKANAELIAEESAKSSEFKNVVASQQAYMKKARAWTNIGEFAYI
ncbi:MAG: ABC transporter substrate-binding protein, partial [Campylobacterales bacterium]|nr:ABC transporter substrate-binding protein [Campylobacterales bacterium]